MVLNAGNILLVGAVLLFVSILAGKAGSKFGVPVLLLFLGVGMVFGSDGLGIQFNSPTIAQFIGMIALSVILFSGGMDTKFKEIRPVLGPGIILATLGVMITTAITGGIIFLVTRYFFGSITLTLYESLLLAAVISSTDSASVFSILRSKGLRLKENLRPMLEFESGSNDPMANILTILFIQVIQVGHMSFGHSAGVLLYADRRRGGRRLRARPHIALLRQPARRRQPVAIPDSAARAGILHLFVHRPDRRQRLSGRLSRRSGDRQQQDAASPQHDDLFRRYRLARPAGHVSDARPARQSDRAAARSQASDC